MTIGIFNPLLMSPTFEDDAPGGGSVDENIYIRMTYVAGAFKQMDGQVVRNISTGLMPSRAGMSNVVAYEGPPQLKNIMCVVTTIPNFEMYAYNEAGFSPWGHDTSKYDAALREQIRYAVYDCDLYVNGVFWNRLNKFNTSAGIANMQQAVHANQFKNLYEQTEGTTYIAEYRKKNP